MVNTDIALRNLSRAAVLGLRSWWLHRRVRMAIARSAVFDQAWYRATYAELGEDDPLNHYLANPEGRRPSPWFDPAWYLQKHPDVAGSGVEPLAHYVLFGAREGRD